MAHANSRYGWGRAPAQWWLVLFPHSSQTAQPLIPGVGSSSHEETPASRHRQQGERRGGPCWGPADLAVRAGEPVTIHTLSLAAALGKGARATGLEGWSGGT